MARRRAALSSRSILSPKRMSRPTSTPTASTNRRSIIAPNTPKSGASKPADREPPPLPIIRASSRPSLGRRAVRKRGALSRVASPRQPDEGHASRRAGSSGVRELFQIAACAVDSENRDAIAVLIGDSKVGAGGVESEVTRRLPAARRIPDERCDASPIVDRQARQAVVAAVADIKPSPIVADLDFRAMIAAA